MAKGKAASASKEMLAGKKSKQDTLVQTAQEVENLSKPKAFELIDELVHTRGYNDFRLGGILAMIQDKAEGEGGESWLDGHESFEDLCDKRFNIEYRKARYLISIYKNLVEKQIPWNTVKDMGWTKLVIVADVITAKNAEQWATRAAKMSAATLKEAVSKAKEKGSSAKDTDIDQTPAVKQVLFKLHKNQYTNVRKALDLAKEVGKTEHDTVALDYLCTAFMTGATPDNSEAEGKTDVKIPKAKKARIELLNTLAKDLDPTALMDALVVAAGGDAEKVFNEVDRVFGKTWKIQVEEISKPEKQAA